MSLWQYLAIFLISPYLGKIPDSRFQLNNLYIFIQNKHPHFSYPKQQSYLVVYTEIHVDHGTL